MLLGIIFIITGFYSLFTKKAGLFTRQNSQPKLAATLYESYVQKSGLNIIGIGAIMLIANLVDEQWNKPIWMYFLVFLGLVGIFFVNLIKLNKKYYGKYFFKFQKASDDFK